LLLATPAAYYSTNSQNYFTLTTITSNNEGIFCLASSFQLVNCSIYNNTNNLDFSGCNGCTFDGSGIVDDNPCNDGCVRDICSECGGNSECVGCDDGNALRKIKG
jgi:hypothetical protein